MPHPMMTACGLSSLHRYKFKKVIGKLKGGSAQRKGAGMRLMVEPMRPAVMPTPTKRQLDKMTTMPVRRTLQMRS